MIEYRGKEHTIRGLAIEHGISPSCLRSRLVSGWDIETALSTPMSPSPAKRKWLYKGWLPKKSRDDKARCKKCRYSEKFGSDICCMYLVLHTPPERRGCEPGKNCTRFKGKTRASETVKLGVWAK